MFEKLLTGEDSLEPTAIRFATMVIKLILAYIFHHTIILYTKIHELGKTSQVCPLLYTLATDSISQYLSQARILL